MKKKLILIFLSVFSAVFLVILICLFHFLSKTISNCRQYCIENTMVNATSFRPVGRSKSYEDNWIQYMFWVAEDGVSDHQELFIFQQVQFGSLDRYRFVNQISGDMDEIVSSVMFTPRDTRNRKQSTNWMVFYSSNSHHISRVIFTVEENGKICTIESGDSTHMPFIFVLPDLGIKDGVYREFVKAEFYDMDRNLVETVVGNGQKTEE